MTSGSILIIDTGSFK